MRRARKLQGATNPCGAVATVDIAMCTVAYWRDGTGMDINGEQERKSGDGQYALTHCRALQSGECFSCAYRDVFG